MGLRNNENILFKGQKVYQKKRKQKELQVEEIKYDPDARKDFLTGFHKRKKERKQAKIKLAKERDSKELKEMKKEQREERKQKIKEAVRNNVGADQSEHESDSTKTNNRILQSKKFKTTVTIIDNFSIDSNNNLEKLLTPKDIIQNLKK
ncbi:hypothetical protein BB558_005623 [Smittium angustum]|uniref:Ribosomal RNA-processing protein 17 n=1 Tax=Smittium angustum TaxID=133377 RepID=A0A2U1IVY2_SMIAN|nr:hypothetical protein BB558_007191 [Smittium angustum]PVZ98365.1 hypothetical protein BB558_005623 [Smittium angustum]